MEPLRLRMWFERGHLSLGDNDQNAPQGGVRLLSPHAVLTIYIATALTKFGVSVPRALTAGMTFAHSRSGRPTRGRPGALYLNNNWTVIVLRADTDRPCDILPLGKKHDPIDLMVKIGEEGAIVLPVDPIVHRIEKAST